MNINRDYLIINDVKKSNVKLDNGSVVFYITDKNTQNIFVNLVINISNNPLIQKYANIENAEDYTLTMNIVKPDNTYEIIQGKLHDKANAIFEFDLPDYCCDKVGSYRCELLTKCYINDREEITTSNKLTYKVKSSVLNDLDEIVEAPEYPLVIQLFDKLSDIEQYEEDRRANELARQLAEDQRQARFDELNADIDNKMVDIENRVSTKEQAVDKLIIDTKADIDEYKAAKDTEINNAITTQDNKINEFINERNDRLNAIEAKNTEQDSRLDVAENRLANIGNDITNTMQPIIDGHTSRLEAIEAIDVAQNNRLDAIEAKNQQQDDRLLDIEKVNNKQDIDIKCLYGASQTIDVTKEGNSIYLQNSNNGFTIVDEIKGNTLVNCNKEPNKELILNGNINTQGDNNITLTEGVDGGLVDVALEGNTLVNVSKTKDSTAITMAYTVENSGNHIALQGDIDGICKPVITGNTLWIDNATEEIVTAFDETKNLRLQSSFEDNLVTQEMVDSGEEVADNLGKYKVDYKSTGKNKLNPTNSKVEGYLSDIGGTTQGRFTQYANADSVSYIYPCLPNTTYTVSHTGNTNTIAEFDKYPISGDAGNIVYNRTFTTSSTTKWLVIYVNSTWTDDDLHAQLEYGDTATSYEPYKEHTKTLYLNSPLLEGDTIEERNGSIYHVHRYSEVILNGSEKWDPYRYNEIDHSNGIYCYVGHNIVADDKGWSSTNILCQEYPSYKNIGNAYYGYKKSISIGGGQILIACDKTDVNEFKQWLQSSSLTVVYEMNNPQYELIEQSNLAIPSYTNGHLDFNTAVPIEKVEFKPFIEELTYLYANTQYTVQFVSDKAITIDIALGGTSLLAQSIVAGLNRISITTPATLADNKLVISGVGANISEVVVTDIDREFDYFEGMKSVGECEDLEVVSRNKNLFNGEWKLGRIDDKTGVEYASSTTKITDFIKVDTNVITCYMPGYIKSNGARYLTVYLYDKNKSFIKCQYLGDMRACYSQDNSGDFSYLRIAMAVTITDCDFDVYDYKINIPSAYTEEHIPHQSNTQTLTHKPLRAVGDTKDRYVLIDGKWYIERKCGVRAYQEGDKDNYKTDLINTVYPLEMATYEEIDYNPFEVYTGTTHITTNSTIPTNITVKNHGYNCLLKPSTTYTISSNLGINTVTTPSVLTEDCLRFMDTDTSDVTTMKDVLVLEGDWTTKADLIPANFSGIESAFEQELVADENDVNYGKYRVTAKVIGKNLFDKNIELLNGYYINDVDGTNTKISGYCVSKDYIRIQPNTTYYGANMNHIGLYDKNKNFICRHGLWGSEKTFTTASNAYYIRYQFGSNDSLSIVQLEEGDTATSYEPYKESTITFYLDEPLRGVGDVKDKVFIKDDKVVVQRNCGIRPYEDGDFGTYPTDKVNTVYQLAEPTYEEIGYNDTKLFIESFKNSTLFYNSNVPVTSKLYYSYSVPIVDTVAQTADVTDQQDQLIIDLATQCAVMEMMLM